MDASTCTPSSLPLLSHPYTYADWLERSTISQVQMGPLRAQFGYDIASNSALNRRAVLIASAHLIASFALNML